MSFTSKKKLSNTQPSVRPGPWAQIHRYFTSLFERERLGSTALGYGIAIPHGRIKGSRGRARFTAETRWNSMRRITTGFVVLRLLVPKDATTASAILGELAQLFGDEAMRASMLAPPRLPK